MTVRKPAGVTFESWVDRQVREATERGEFDDLPGTGRPIESLTGRYEEMWWVKQKLREEKLAYLPPALQLRKEAQQARDAALAADTEPEARLIITDINDRIREAIKNPPPGPPVDIAPYDVEQFIQRWRQRHRP